VNVSLDTLRRDRAAELARRDVLPAVLRGVDAAVEAGLTPVKLNAVVMRGVNDDELADLVDFALERGAERRCIEYMPMGPARRVGGGGGTDAGVAGAGREAAGLKWAGHDMTAFVPLYSRKEMVAIGG